MAQFDIKKVKVYVYEHNYDTAHKGWYDISIIATDEVKQEFIDVLDIVDDELSEKEAVWADEYAKQYGEPLFTWDSARYANFLKDKIRNYIDRKRVNNFVLNMQHDGVVYGGILHECRLSDNSNSAWMYSENIRFVYENK